VHHRGSVSSVGKHMKDKDKNKPRQDNEQDTTPEGTEKHTTNNKMIGWFLFFVFILLSNEDTVFGIVQLINPNPLSVLKPSPP
jgi:hypothetical protein